jgi:hypothetical protein
MGLSMLYERVNHTTHNTQTFNSHNISRSPVTILSISTSSRMKHLALLLLLSLAAKDGSAETALRATTQSYSASHQRRELGFTDWWYTLLNHLHVPCPPGHHDEDGHRKGHCDHPSHPKHPDHKSGGSSHKSSSSSSSSGSSSSSTSTSTSTSTYCSYTCDGSNSSCKLCAEVCQDTCDGSTSNCVLCENIPQCSDNCADGDESCVSCSSGWSPDGWTGDAWAGDAWTGDAWQGSYSRTGSGSSGSSKAWFWGIGAGLCALVAGAALFMTRVSLEHVPLTIPRNYLLLRA